MPKQLKRKADDQDNITGQQFNELYVQVAKMGKAKKWTPRKIVEMRIVLCAEHGLWPESAHITAQANGITIKRLNVWLHRRMNIFEFNNRTINQTRVKALAVLLTTGTHTFNSDTAPRNTG